MNSERWAGFSSAWKRPDGPLLMLGLAPALLALLYPLSLDGFHLLVDAPTDAMHPVRCCAAAILLAMSFAPSLSGIACAMLTSTGKADVSALEVRSRRLAYAAVTAPTLYTMLGVLQALISSPIPDEVVWSLGWTAAMLCSALAPLPSGPAGITAPRSGLRVAHGISALILVVYVLFHLTNHLFALEGEGAHTAVMAAGRKIYRSSVGEPILVSAMLFQVITGFSLAWRWSGLRGDFFRTFQIASGLYLAVYIVGHMNSVFVYARIFLGIPTGWAFATGAPTGLIHDAWSVRLIPHYALGVFFVVGHLSSAVRAVMLAHGTPRRVADLILISGAVIGATTATVILMAMCGFRLVSV